MSHRNLFSENQRIRGSCFAWMPKIALNGETSITKLKIRTALFEKTPSM